MICSQIFIDDDTNDTLSYTASSSDPMIVKPMVSGDILTVRPISVGRAIITVIANDGRGSTTSTKFAIEIDGLLLLHQTANTFYLYSKIGKSVMYVRRSDIVFLSYYGLADIF